MGDLNFSSLLNVTCTRRVRLNRSRARARFVRFVLANRRPRGNGNQFYAAVSRACRNDDTRAAVITARALTRHTIFFRFIANFLFTDRRAVTRARASRLFTFLTSSCYRAFFPRRVSPLFSNLVTLPIAECPIAERPIHGTCKVNSYLPFFIFRCRRLVLARARAPDVLEYGRLLETGYDITRFRTSCAAFHLCYTRWPERS